MNMLNENIRTLRNMGYDVQWEGSQTIAVAFRVQNDYVFIYKMAVYDMMDDRAVEVVVRLINNVIKGESWKCIANGKSVFEN